MKPQKAVLLAALIIIVFTAQLFAEEAKCTLIKVASKGMKLTDIYSGKIKDALVVQLVNGIKNPYELKEGLKLIIPEKEFIEKVSGLETAGMAKEIAS